MIVPYVNLHHHSTFSHGDGFGTPKQHVERAAALGYGAIALTEHGNVSSHWQLKKAADKAGIKPIYGLEAYCGGTTEESRTQWKHHLTILARDVTGYQNLMRIVSQSFRDHYFHPTVSGGTLVDNIEGLIVLSGCAGSLLACTLAGGKATEEHLDKPDIDAALEVADRFSQLLFDDFFLEVQPFPDLPRIRVMNAAYQVISRELKIPMVVTCDVHYPLPEHNTVQAMLHAIHRGHASVDDAMRAWNYEVLLTLPTSIDELGGKLVDTGLTKKAAFGAIETSVLIADRCNVELPTAERLRYPISEGDFEPWV